MSFIFSDFARNAAKKSTNVVVDKLSKSSTRMTLESNFRNTTVGDNPTPYLYGVVDYARALGGRAMKNDEKSFVVDNGKWLYMFSVCGMSGNGGVDASISDQKELIACLVAAINC